MSEITLENTINVARTSDLSTAQSQSMEKENKTIRMLNKQGSKSNSVTSDKEYDKQNTPQWNYLKITRGNHSIHQTNVK